MPNVFELVAEKKEQVKWKEIQPGSFFFLGDVLCCKPAWTRYTAILEDGTRVSVDKVWGDNVFQGYLFMADIKYQPKQQQDPDILETCECTRKNLPIPSKLPTPDDIAEVKRFNDQLEQFLWQRGNVSLTDAG